MRALRNEVQYLDRAYVHCLGTCWMLRCGKNGLTCWEGAEEGCAHEEDMKAHEGGVSLLVGGDIVDI